jgi:hypothetical protein
LAALENHRHCDLSILAGMLKTKDLILARCRYVQDCFPESDFWTMMSVTHDSEE